MFISVGSFHLLAVARYQTIVDIDKPGVRVDSGEYQRAVDKWLK